MILELESRRTELSRHDSVETEHSLSSTVRRDGAVGPSLPTGCAARQHSVALLTYDASPVAFATPAAAL